MQILNSPSIQQIDQNLQKVIDSKTYESRDLPEIVKYIGDYLDDEYDRLYRCFNCQGFGHWGKDCPTRICNWCHQQGHWKNKCPRNRGTRYYHD